MDTQELELQETGKQPEPQQNAEAARPARRPAQNPNGQPRRRPAQNADGQPARRPAQNADGQPRRRPAQNAEGQPARRPAQNPNGQPARRPAQNAEGQPARRPAQNADGQPKRRPAQNADGQPVRRTAQNADGQPVRRTAPNAEGQPARRPAQNPNGQPARRPAQNAEGQPVRRSADGQPVRRPAQPGRKPGQPGSASAQRRPAQNQNGQPSRGPQAMTPERRAAAEPRTAKRTVNRFRVGMAIYVSLFFIALLIGLYRFKLFLGEYEASRPDHTIENYVQHLTPDFYTDMIKQSTSGIALSDYETQESLLATLDTAADTDSAYSWGKKGDEYKDDRPVYNIRRGNVVIASVALQAVGKTDKFDFPVWEVEPTATSRISVSTTPEYSVNVTVPADANLVINGVPVAAQNMTSVDSPIVKLDDAAKTLAAQPAALTFSASGLYAVPDVQATDAAGTPLKAVTAPAASDKEQTYVFEPSVTLTPEEGLTERIEAITRSYINYMINEDLDNWGNLEKLCIYLLTDSTAYNMMRSIVGDVYWNNPYTARNDKVLEISNIKMYSPDVCTCEAHFELELTRDDLTNDYNGTVMWTLVRHGTTWDAVDMKLMRSADDADTAETPEAAADEQTEAPADAAPEVTPEVTPDAVPEATPDAGQEAAPIA